MSFNREARRVRDESLPYGSRYSALRKCVEYYSPIGFENTWRFIGDRAGELTGGDRDLRSDSRALVLALGLVEASRDMRLRQDVEYAAERKVEKARGHRSTGVAWPRSVFNRSRWHGDEARAARFVIAWWRWKQPPRPRDGCFAAVRRVVDAALSVPEAYEDAVRAALDEAHREVSTQIAEYDRLWAEEARSYWDERFTLAKAREVLWHVAVALDGADAAMPPLA